MTTLPPEPNGEQPAAQDQPAVPPVPPPPAAPAAPQYEAPPAGAYQAPPAGAYQQQPVADSAASTITLNYWLSVFFAWIPALIFWIIEKDKGNQRALQFHVANLNFSLLRTGVGLAAAILGVIPYLGWLIALLAWIAGIVLFVFHIMAAVKAPEAYKSGDPKTDQFVFNIPLIKS